MIEEKDWPERAVAYVHRVSRSPLTKVIRHKFEWVIAGRFNMETEPAPDFGMPEGVHVKPNYALRACEEYKEMLWLSLEASRALRE